MSPVPIPKIIQITAWRDGLIALDDAGRLFYGFAPYNHTDAIIPIMEWTLLSLPDSVTFKPIPPYGRVPDLK